MSDLAFFRLETKVADTFTRHNVDRPIPVESLIKCKMQDNLEFLQWTKRFWDQYFPGGEYDAIARRKASGALPPGPPATAARTSGTSSVRRGVTPTTTGTRPKAAGVGPASAALVNENSQLKETVTGLERERDFYFSKLRDIELLVQQAMEANPDLEKDDTSLEKQIQNILYSTEVWSILFCRFLLLVLKFCRKALRSQKGKGRLDQVMNWKHFESIAAQYHEILSIGSIGSTLLSTRHDCTAWMEIARRVIT